MTRYYKNLSKMLGCSSYGHNARKFQKVNGEAQFSEKFHRKFQKIFWDSLLVWCEQTGNSFPFWQFRPALVCFATPFRAQMKGVLLVLFNAQILTNFTYHMHYKQIKNIIRVHAYSRGRFSCWCTLDQTGDMIGTFFAALKFFSSRILFKIY